jgi:hypothetical protein
MVAMQAASLSRPEEVTMLIRRILACACALALAVPAVASARPGFDPPATTQHVAYGDTKYDLQNQQDLGAPASKGDTKNDIAPPAPERRIMVPAGKSGGEVIGVVAQRHTTPAAGSTDDGTNGWRIAAVAEAGLLAALALGSAMVVARMRPRHGLHP